MRQATRKRGRLRSSWLARAPRPRYYLGRSDGGRYVDEPHIEKGNILELVWHPTDEHVTVLAGSFLVAHGDKYDAPRLVELKPGAHAVQPANMPHFGLHKAGNVIEVYGEGPFIVNFVNPEDDPGRATKK